jgi:DNA-binding NtrC family response regulator
MMMKLAAFRGNVPARIVETLRIHGIELTRTGTAGCPLIVSTSGLRRRAWPKAPSAPWIWLTRRDVSAGQRTDAVLAGAYDVIALNLPDAGEALAARLAELVEPPPAPAPAPTLVTESEASRQIVAQVARVAPTSMSVLFTGETGTGKEVMARQLHAWSARQKKPFIPINCAAIPNELMEAELFGYARGAFSGAVQRYDGQLMAAEGGTVFLDEIDETPPETQVKLLRVLEDRVVSRLGENLWREVDFRLLAATNRDLQMLIQAGLFGADLYERLAIVTIHLVPLRERLEDLPQLARQFMARFAHEQNRPAVTDIRRDARAALSAYPWPGNIRELRNVVYETLVYKRAGTQVIPSDLPRRILRRTVEIRRDATIDRMAIARKIERGTMNLKEEVAALERLAIDEALKRSGGNAALAARLLGQVGRGVSRDPGGTVRAMLRRLKDPTPPR